MPERLADLIHHITTLASPDQLGRTRIAKILWLSDVEAYRRTGKTITGSDDYVKDQHGPRHRSLYDAIDTLKAAGKVTANRTLTTAGLRQELVPLDLPDVSKFTADEIAIVDRITAVIIKLTASQASEITHDALWKAAYFNERIPVAAAAPIEGELTPEIAEWADSVFDEYSAPT